MQMEFVYWRWIIIAILHVGWFTVHAHRAALSIIMVAMTASAGNQEAAEGARKYHWSQEDQGFILGAYFGGFGFTLIIGGYLSQKVRDHISSIFLPVWFHADNRRISLSNSYPITPHISACAYERNFNIW